MKSIAWMLFLSVAAVVTKAQGQEQPGMVVLAAEEAAREREARLKEAGVVVDAADMKAIRAIEQARIDMRDVYKRLIEDQKAFTAAKNTKRIAEIAADKKQLLLIARKLDMSPENEHNPDTAISYMSKVREFRGQSGKKTKEWIERAKKKADQYEKELGKKPGTDAAGTSPTTGGGAGAAGGGGGVAGARAVYINSVSGDVEFFIDDTRVERGQQAIPVGDSFTLRARAMGKKRKSLLEMTAPEHTTVNVQNDYQVKYTTDTGNFRGSTDWRVEDETYRWSVTKPPNSHASFEQADSGKGPVVHQDVARFRFDGSFGFAADVSAEVKWKATSERPGGTRQMEDVDTVRGHIDLAIAGR
jgi:hypothetical protein